MALISIVCTIFIFSFGIFSRAEATNRRPGVTDVTVSRHLRVLNVEIDMLRSILSKKESVRRQLEHCVTSLETRVNDTSDRASSQEFGIHKMKSIVKDLKHLTITEKDVYQNIIKKMDEIFPNEIQMQGPGNTREMLTELGHILNHLSDVSPDSSNTNTPECGVTGCLEPATPHPNYLTSFTLSNCRRCYLSSFALVENHNILVPFYGDRNVKLYSGQNGTLLNTFNFDFRPSSVEYGENGSFYVDTIPRNDRFVYRYDMASGEQTLITSIDGDTSLGLKVLDGMLFIGGEYGGGMRVKIPGTYRLTQISNYITNYDQFYSAFMCPTDPHSKLGLFSGNIVGNRYGVNGIALITSIGERICSIMRQYVSYACGAVSQDGYFYTPGEGQIWISNNRCEIVGAFDTPGYDSHAREIDILGDKLYVNTHGSHFVVFQLPQGSA